MKTFEQFINEIALPTDINPKDMDRRKTERRDKTERPNQVDFDDPAFAHSYNKALKDDEKWPPKPLAKYKADQIRWAVTAGKQPEHLANES